MVADAKRVGARNKGNHGSYRTTASMLMLGMPSAVWAFGPFSGTRSSAMLPMTTSGGLNRYVPAVRMKEDEGSEEPVVCFEHRAATLAKKWEDAWTAVNQAITAEPDLDALAEKANEVERIPEWPDNPAQMWQALGWDDPERGDFVSKVMSQGAELQKMELGIGKMDATARLIADLHLVSGRERRPGDVEKLQMQIAVSLKVHEGLQQCGRLPGLAAWLHVNVAEQTDEYTVEEAALDVMDTEFFRKSTDVLRLIWQLEQFDDPCMPAAKGNDAKCVRDWLARRLGARDGESDDAVASWLLEHGESRILINGQAYGHGVDLRKVRPEKVDCRCSHRPLCPFDVYAVWVVKPEGEFKDIQSLQQAIDDKYSEGRNLLFCPLLGETVLLVAECAPAILGWDLEGRKDGWAMRRIGLATSLRQSDPNAAVIPSTNP